MATSGLAGSVLSVIMSIIMAFSGLPVGTILNNAENWDKDQIAKERMQLLADYMDGCMQLYYGGPVYLDSEGDGYESVEEIPEGNEYFEVDISSINNFLTFAKNVIEDETVYGGDFTSLDFSALDGKALAEDNALEIVYDAVQFMTDNADAIGKVITADFDYGKLGTVLPEVFGEEGALRNFDIYEVIMDWFLEAYSNGDYTTSPSLYQDENGGLRLAYRNNIYDHDQGTCYHDVDDCGLTDNENVFHSSTYVSTRSVYNEETGSYESVEYEYVRCYTALTDEEKSVFNADGKIAEWSSAVLESSMLDLGMDETEASEFVADMDFNNMGVYAVIPAVLNEILDLGSDAMGDTLHHYIRQFFIFAYGGTSYNGNLYYESPSVIVEGEDYYSELYDYYYSQFTQGDYALFDLEITDCEYKMFEASYKEDGSLVFYPYYESVKDKDVQQVVESLFDFHFAVPSDYEVTEEEYEAIVASGSRKFIGTDGEAYYLTGSGVYKFFESVFPVAEDVSGEEIAALTEADKIAADEIGIIVDGSLEGLSINEAYYKDGRFYISRYDTEGNLTWTAWTTENETEICSIITEALSGLCSIVEPYYIYNDNQYDYVEHAKELGGGFAEQLNNIIGTVIENSWTDEAKAEFEWVKGGNENLNDNVIGIIRYVTGKVFTPDVAGQLQACVNALDQFNDNDIELVIYLLESLVPYCDAEYYKNTDLEGIVLDAILTVYDIVNYNSTLPGQDSFEFLKDFEMPENVTSLEALTAYILTCVLEELFDDISVSSKYIEDGALIDMSEEEWKNLALDTGFEIFIRVWADKADSSAVVFTKEEIDDYKLKGWGYLDFLDEIFDRFYVYIEGFAAVCDDLQCELGVYDGNGPWYKISRILNALLPVASLSNCSKTYGDETLPFDLGVFFEEGIVGNLFDIDFSGMFSILTENANNTNPFYGNNIVKAILICLQNFVNAVLPGSIADEDIVSVDHLISEDTVAKVAVQMITAINDRKTELIPLIISWFDLVGVFAEIPYIDVESGFAYFIREDEDGKYVSVSDYHSGENFNLTVPEEIKGLPVKGYEITYGVGSGATVELPDTLKYFDTNGYYAGRCMFVVSENNEYLESVDGVLYDEEITQILSYPYFKTDEEYVVPSTVKTVYSERFCNAKYLKTLVLSEGVEELLVSTNTNWSWYDYYDLDDLYIPTSCRVIDPYAIRYNYDITIHGAVNSYAYEFYNDVIRENYSYLRASFEVYNPNELYVTFDTENQAVKSNIYVYGYTLPGATIKIYDGDELIGKDNNVKGNCYSKWEANVPLYNPVDTGSYHDITVVAEKDGETVTSRTITVYYEKDAIVFKEFRMVHNNYYEATVTDETINYIRNLTWIPGCETDFRVRILNSKKLSAVYLVSEVDGQVYRTELKRAEKDYWVADNGFLGNPPGVIRIEGVVKNKGKLETIQIGGDIKINYLIDPSGNVYEFNSANPLEGVTATVQYYDSDSGEWVTWDAEYYEQLNPIVTDKSGGFKWIVPKGSWRVVCEKEGYNTYISSTYSIPPEKTGLQYYMTTNTAPTVKECTYNNGVITLVYDQYMTSGALESSNYSVDGAVITGVSGKDVYYDYNGYSAYKTVEIYCTAEDGSALTTAPAGLTISNVYNYNYIEIADGTTVVPDDLTKYYNITVEADDTDVTVGDLVTLTLSTTDAMGETVNVSVSNSSVFDTQYNEYDEEGNITSATDVTIPETVTFDENGNATLTFAAGFEGTSYITFSLGGTSVSYYAQINANAETDHTHEYGEAVVVESTCLLAGYSYQECECGEILYTAYDLAGHTPVEKVTEEAMRTEATCRASATYYYTCDICGEVLDEEEDAEYFSNGDRLSHELDENGACNNCSYVEVQPEKECEHTTTETYTVPATCTEYGIENAEICLECGDILGGTMLPPSHTAVTDKAVAATCTKTGLTEGSHCSVCNEVLVAQTATEKLEHTAVTDKAVAATCTKTGLTEGSHCSVCNEVLVAQTATEKLEHTAVTDKAVAATCTNTGLTEGSHCSVCNEVLVAQTATEKLEHTAVTDKAVAATCTKTGLTEGSHCSVCNEVLVAQTATEKLEHTAVTDKAVAATCTNTGLTEGSHCSVCNEVLVAQTTVEKTQHNVVISGAKEATDTEDGYTGDKVCSDCDAVIEKGEKIPATGGSCGHMCHKSGINKLIWNILKVFFKLFKIQPVCDCGVAHY